MRISPTLFPCALLTATLAAPLGAQDIPYGIEFVTGIRTGYLHRGVELAQDLTDVQLQANVTLSQTQSVDISLWHGAEISGDFAEFGALLAGTQEFVDFSLTVELSYTHYEQSPLDSGVELAVGVDVPLGQHVSSFAQLSYHQAEASIFGQLGAIATHRLSDDSYLTLLGEVNFASDYLRRSGLYDLSTRLSYTHNVNSSLSITPYAALALALDEAPSTFSAGVWVELFF